jgi:hypothetical protein
VTHRKLLETTAKTEEAGGEVLREEKDLVDGGEEELGLGYFVDAENLADPFVLDVADGGGGEVSFTCSLGFGGEERG